MVTMPRMLPGTRKRIIKRLKAAAEEGREAFRNEAEKISRTKKNLSGHMDVM